MNTPIVAPITENTLFYGDNVSILQDYFTADSVDLIHKITHWTPTPPLARLLYTTHCKR